MSSRHRGESFAPRSRYRGESVFSAKRRECPPAICRGDRLLLNTNETESVLSPQRRFSLRYMQRRQTPTLDRGGSVFSTQRIECPSAIFREGKLLLSTCEKSGFSIQRESAPLPSVRRLCPSAICREGRRLLYTEERVSSLD